MINRSHRFHGRGSLKIVYARGQVVRTGQIALRYFKNDRRKTYRAAVIVSRKVSKSAVVRNRIRRRIYEEIRLFEPKMVSPYDLVMTVYTDSLATDSAEKINQLIEEVMTKSGATTGARDIVNT